MPRIENIHGLLAGNDIEIGWFEIGARTGGANPFAAQAAAHQAWVNRWMTAVGWVPVPHAFAVAPQINHTHWFSPPEYARLQSWHSRLPPSQMTRDQQREASDEARDYPIRDVRGYAVLPATWSRNWDARDQSSWDFNRRPPPGSATAPEPSDMWSTYASSGGSGHRRQGRALRML